MVKEIVYSECGVIPGPRKASHIACNHEAHITPWWWRGIRYFHRTLLFPPPLRFAEAPQSGYGRQYPADACGAICLAFRGLAKLSGNIRSINLEMIQN
jgi:hypothetical protein